MTHMLSMEFSYQNRSFKVIQRSLQGHKSSFAGHWSAIILPNLHCIQNLPEFYPYLTIQRSFEVRIGQKGSILDTWRQIFLPAMDDFYEN